MTARLALDSDSHQQLPSKRPRLLDTTNMTNADSPTAQRSPGLKRTRSGEGAAAAAAAAARAAGALGRSGLVDRTQYIRLLEQALSSLGFADVATQLERASGIASQPAEVNHLQRAVLAGDWAAATQLVRQLDLGTQALQEAQFLILEQAFLEALQAGNSSAALSCLRDQLTPLGVHPHRLHRLAACLMSGRHAAAELAGAELAADAELSWREADAPPCDARQRLLRRLQTVVPPELMLPERRLEDLVEQALQAQIQACRYHNSPGARPSLLKDYSCGTEQIPTCTTQVLLDHSDEVWHLQFSHDGRMLASCGKDQTAIIWEVQRSRHSSGRSGGGGSGGDGGGGGSGSAGESGGSPGGPSSSPGGGSGGRPGGVGSGGAGVGSIVVKWHVLRGHSGPIAFICWSPDDTKLATCGQDALRLWDTASGKCLSVFRHHKEPVTCAAWFPDGQKLVTGSHDKQLCIVSLDGTVERQWRIQRIQEVLVAKGGRYILATTCERKVRVYDLQEDTESYIPEAEPLISMSLSRDGRYLLVNLTSNSMHLWDCGEAPGELRMPAMPCAAYNGASDKQSRFVVRSCLGGLDDRFVLTGSEECRVYVYHRATGERLLSLEGHSGTVNSVAWNPADPHMFASASDDKSIHIWQTPPHPAAAGAGSGGEALQAATQ